VRGTKAGLGRDTRTSAIVCLCELGFSEMCEPPVTSKDSRPFDRPDGAAVDLHQSFVGVSAGPDRCWDVLSSEATPEPLSSGCVETLSESARAVIFALHADQYGADELKSIQNLAVAVASLPFDVWAGAGVSGKEPGALESIVAGIRHAHGGADLAAQHGLPEDASPRLLVRTASGRTSRERTRFLHADGSDRRQLLRPVLAPTTEELRRRAWNRSVVDWPGGGVLARIIWWVRVSLETPVASWWYLRTRVRRSSLK
jgi:hypothetical protein